MNVKIEIGENYNFELHEALLVYRASQNNSAFIMRHPVGRSSGSGAPTLGTGEPLTWDFVRELVRNLGGNTAPEVLPPCVIARTESMIAWWTPPQRRQMFYSHHTGDLADLNGKVFPQPALVFIAGRSGLWVRALRHNRRPEAGTRLLVAPFWNTAANGLVCSGSMRQPHGMGVGAMPVWEKAFYESAFTHAGAGVRLTSHPGGFGALWRGIAGTRGPFPVRHLVEAKQTLSGFLNEGRLHAD